MAFTAVYIIWGSSYLGIQIAIETIPPFLMAGVRFLVAGTILFAFARWRGAPAPASHHWGPALLLGALLLLGGNGAVVWAEQRVPSGLASMLVADEPLWVVLLQWMFFGALRPTAKEMFGIGLGFAGVVFLVVPADLLGAAPVDLTGAAVLIGGSISWAFGALFSRSARLPSSTLLSTAMQMLTGGTLLLLFAAVTGEWARLDVGNISFRSLAALAYLIVFAGIITFTAFIWLLRVVSPAMVATHSYVNPVVAVFLGWLLAAEPVTGRTLLASAIIVGSVALILISGREGAPPVETDPAAGAEPPAPSSS